jgi:hypothetical protein
VIKITAGRHTVPKPIGQRRIVQGSASESQSEFAEYPSHGQDLTGRQNEEVKQRMGELECLEKIHPVPYKEC